MSAIRSAEGHMRANASNLWRDASDWLMSRATAPPALGRGSAAVIPLAMLCSIGVADYACGLQISLAVFYFIPILLTVAWFGWQSAVAAAVASVVLRWGRT